MKISLFLSFFFQARREKSFISPRELRCLGHDTSLDIHWHTAKVFQKQYSWQIKYPRRANIFCPVKYGYWRQLFCCYRRDTESLHIITVTFYPSFGPKDTKNRHIMWSNIIWNIRKYSPEQYVQDYSLYTSLCINAGEEKKKINYQ